MAETLLVNEALKILWDFVISNRSLNPGQKTNLVEETKNKTYQILDFVISVDHSIKRKDD